jgi:hypothetical protein
MSYHFCPECGGECIQCEAIFNGLIIFEEYTCSALQGAEDTSDNDDGDSIREE